MNAKAILTRGEEGWDMSNFMHATTNKEVSLADVQRAPILLHAGLHGRLRSLVFDDDAMFQEWLGQAGMPELLQMADALGQHRAALAAETALNPAHATQERAEAQFANACAQLGLEPDPKAIAAVLAARQMGDPVTLFDQAHQGGNWKTFWVTFPDLAPDWNDRAVSVRFFPGPFNPLPFATLHSQPYFQGRQVWIGGFPESDIDLAPLGFARQTVSIYMGG